MESPAFATLLACMETPPFDQVKLDHLTQIPTGEWQEVVKLAGMHNLAPRLYHHLKQHSLSLPGEVISSLKEAYLNNTARNMRLYHELAKVLRTLLETNLPVIVLKGAALAETVYSNIGLRPMGDVDLLVRKEDLKNVDRVLRSMGCEAQGQTRVVLKGFHHFHYTTPRTGLSLEIHWDLVNADLPFRIDLEGIWKRAEIAEVSGEKCLILSAEDLLLHLCLHTGRHVQYLQLSMLVDIDEVIRSHHSIDWTQVSRRAQQWGILRPVYVILRLCRELLGAGVQADWLKSIQPEDFREEYMDIIRKQFSTPEAQAGITPAKYVTLLSQENNFLRKLKILRDRLFPTRRSMALIYPAPENSWRIFFYYPVRWRYLLSQYGKLVWQMIQPGQTKGSAATENKQGSVIFDWFFPNSNTSDRDL
jgi:hypothetical protein